MPDKRFIDKDGREVFVHDGISDGRWWGAFKRKANGRLQRVKAVPVYEDRVEAECALDAYAARRGLKEIGAKVE
ncbi:MAG: hypothetical protein HPY55_06630 [Firmicutes bacterium]|nr:hypothetical protein [Bacillota bacterium]